MTVKHKPGFSILELLIVFAIVGILAAGMMYALNVSRAKSRDAKRVSDVSVLRSALNQYWLQKASYPVHPGVDLGKPGENANGLTMDGFTNQGGSSPVILSTVPVGPNTGEYYHYEGTLNGYAIRFQTEQVTAFGPKGTYYAHPGGVNTQSTP